jgi:hypothetical protein
MSGHSDSSLHVWQAPCGCAQLECDCGCHPLEILRALNLPIEQVLCDRHKAEYQRWVAGTLRRASAT